MITLTNAQMLDSLQVLSQLEETGMLGFAIAQNRRKLSAEVEEYSAKYNELLAKYGTDKGGGQFTLRQKDLPAFEKELRPFAEMTAEVAVAQVSLADFCGGKLTSSQMFVLDWMVKED